jgi:VanZ family protein
MILKNKFTILSALVIIYLSLAGSQTFGTGAFINIPYIDKIGHFVLYFVLMAVIIFEHRNYFRDTRHLLLIALVPICFGVLMEFCQMLLTSDRKGEVLDAIFDCAGVGSALYIWMVYKPYHRDQIK